MSRFALSLVILMLGEKTNHPYRRKIQRGIRICYQLGGSVYISGDSDETKDETDEILNKVSLGVIFDGESEFDICFHVRAIFNMLDYLRPPYPRL